jgi:hypothetical protein
MLNVNKPSSKKVATKLLVIFIVGVFLLGALPLTQCQEGEGGVYISPPTRIPATPSTATAKPSPTNQPTDTSDTETDDTGGSSYHRVTPRKSSGSVDFALIGEILLGIILVVGGLFSGFMIIRRRGPNESRLRRLSYTEYQAWVLKKMRGTAASSMDTAHGIDGFTSVGYPVSIKQSDSVSMRDVDLFASSVARKKARNGVIVAFGFSTDAIRGKVRARRSYGLDIQMLTVSELIMSRDGGY